MQFVNVVMIKVFVVRGWRLTWNNIQDPEYRRSTA